MLVGAPDLFIVACVNQHSHMHLSVDFGVHMTYDIVYVYCSTQSCHTNTGFVPHMRD